MANFEREMRLRPAKWPLDTLDACVRDFLWRRAPGGGFDVKADDIPAMCAEAKDFPDAVWMACASRRRNGKMHTHQTKVRVEARREFGARIIERYTWGEGFSRPRTFDEFHDTLWDIRPEGIGQLTTYDVSVRAGAFLSLEPDKIYLHTGARQGWEAMWGGPRMIPRQGTYPTVCVPREIWPRPLLRLSADMAEDFLCAYRDALKGIKRNPSGAPI